MIAKDFEYADEFLSDRGYMICSTDSSSSLDSVDDTASMSFDSVSLFNGKYLPLTVSYYEDRAEITFHICKFVCPDGLTPFSVYEIREIKRWLMRPEYHKFKLIQPNWSDIYMEGSFNVSQLEMSGVVYVLELTFISNRPFALHEPITFRFTSSSSDNSFTFLDESDEIGYIYPDVKITCLQAGTLEISNSIENRKTIIKNVSKNEVIHFSSVLTIDTSVSTHKLQNDFNYIFLRVANKYWERKNTLSFSIPCTIELTYSPYVKVVQ